MKKILLILSLFLSSKAFTQTVEYFGGVYDCKVYFNWVFQNEDSCYFTIEFSEDSGRTYREAGRDSVQQVPVPVMHGIKIETGCEEVWVRLIATTGGRTMVFQPQNFTAGRYHYPTKSYISKIIHADL